MSRPQYLDIRPASVTAAADIAKHWQSRQVLGKALVVCANPAKMQQQFQRQWQRLVHSLQTERTQAMASDELLRLTHRIIRMQELSTGTQLPQHAPDAQVYFLHPADVAHCSRGEYYSVYIAAQCNESQMILLADMLPVYGMAVCYQPFDSTIQVAHLQPRAELDRMAAQQWQVVHDFLGKLEIDLDQLSQPTETRSEHIDHALDILLEHRHVADFLYLSMQFKAIRQFAEPNDISNHQRRLYDTLIVLARQVQALTPATFGEQFHAGIDDPMFFLNDAGKLPALQALFSPLGSESAWQAIVPCAT